MRTYQLYLIEEEFAAHYFGRERMFYELFLEYSRSFGELNTILARQVDYITKPIQGLRLHQYISQQLQRKKDFRIENGAYYIENGKLGSAKLEIYDKYILIQAAGSFESETVFFEILRKNEDSFLAIELEQSRYGWLKPIKERKYV